MDQKQRTLEAIATMKACVESASDFHAIRRAVYNFVTAIDVEAHVFGDEDLGCLFKESLARRGKTEMAHDMLEVSRPGPMPVK